MTDTAVSTTPFRTDKRKAFLHSVFTTAMEGGIGYWGSASVYHWGINVPAPTEGNPDQTRIADDVDGFNATIHPDEVCWGGDTAYQKIGDQLLRQLIGEKDPLVIDIDVVERGTLLWVDKILEMAKDPVGVKNWHVYDELVQFLVAWITDGQDGDFDASMADAVVQYGLFGEQVYG